jgi:hypothetical protein
MKSAYSKSSPCHIISEILASGRPVPPDMEGIVPGSLTKIMPEELLDLESEIVSKSFADNPLIANEVYRYACGASEKKRVFDSMIRGMKGMDPKIPLQKLIIEASFYYYEDLFRDLMVSLCSEKGVSKEHILTSIGKLSDNLSIVPQYPFNLPVIDDMCEIEDEIYETIRRGEDLRPIYEKIARKIIFEVDSHLEFLYNDPEQNRERFLARSTDFVSQCFEKEYVDKLSPHFKEKRQALIDTVLNLLD